MYYQINVGLCLWCDMNVQEKLTSQETNVLMACKADALREFTVGGTVAAGVTWLGILAYLLQSKSSLYKNCRFE